LDRIAEETPWVGTPKKQRALFSAIATAVVGVGIVMLGLVEKTIQAWLFAGIFWALSGLTRLVCVDASAGYFRPDFFPF
jgi:hypothetical protein